MDSSGASYIWQTQSTPQDYENWEVWKKLNPRQKTVNDNIFIHMPAWQGLYYWQLLYAYVAICKVVFLSNATHSTVIYKSTRRQPASFIMSCQPVQISRGLPFAPYSRGLRNVATVPRPFQHQKMNSKCGWLVRSIYWTNNYYCLWFCNM